MPETTPALESAAFDASTKHAGDSYSWESLAPGLKARWVLVARAALDAWSAHPDVRALTGGEFRVLGGGR